MKKFFVLLVLIGMIGVTSYYNEGYCAFGFHESKHEIRVDDPVISIQDSKANVIWQSVIKM